MNTLIRPELTAINTGHSTSAEILYNSLDNIYCSCLDYGCGCGRNLTYLLDRGLKNLYGTDIREQLILQEDKLSLLRQKDVKIYSLPLFTDNTYYGILCSHVLNVIESDETKLAVLNDIYRLLIDEGVAVIEVRTGHDIKSAKTKQPHGEGYLMKKGSSYTYQEEITVHKLDHLCTKAGFTITSHICNSCKHIITVTK